MALFQPAVKSLDRRAVAPRDHSRSSNSPIRPARMPPTSRWLIDAMDLLHSGPVRRLLPGIVRQRLHTPGFPYSRTRGRRLRIFGEQKTPESFRQACRRFTYTENLLPDAPAQVGERREQDQAASAAQRGRADHPPGASIHGWTRKTDGLRLALSATSCQPVIRISTPAISAFASSSDLVRMTNAFEIDHPEGRAMRIRKKEVPAKASNATEIDR